MANDATETRIPRRTDAECREERKTFSFHLDPELTKTESSQPSRTRCVERRPIPPTRAFWVGAGILQEKLQAGNGPNRGNQIILDQAGEIIGLLATWVIGFDGAKSYWTCGGLFFRQASGSGGE